MIKPEDLRIGNWLQFEDKPVQVESIDPLRELPERNLKCSIQIKEWLTDKHYTYTGKWLNRFEPLQLTPEWLENCGFVKDRNGWHLPNTQFSLTDNLFPCWLDRMLWPGGLPDFNNIQLQYVHQLQNMFYTLTGKEIQIKEPA